MKARLALSILLPFIACATQWLFWDALAPYAWLLFFPAAFFSAWIGGLGGGLAATFISALLVWYVFMPPAFSLALNNPASAFSIGIFILMGSLFALFFERLRQAIRWIDEALTAAEAANQAISRQSRPSQEHSPPQTQFFTHANYNLGCRTRTRISALLASQQHTREELDLGTKRLRRLAEAVKQIAAVRDQSSLMNIVRHTMRELTGADGVTLILRDQDQCHYVDEDAVGPLWKGQRFPLTHCISGWVMIHAEAAVIEDIYLDPRIPHAAYRPTFVKSLAMVPIGRDAPVGAIGCYWAEQHLASTEELEFQQALADAMSVGLTNLELYRDLTRARQAAEQSAAAAQDNEQRFRATFEQAAMGIALVAPDGRWLQANQKLCDIVAYPHDELLTKTFQDITHPEDLLTDLASIQQILAGEIDTYAMEKRYLRKDGTLIWVNLTVALVRHPDGTPDYFISVVEDIQRRKEAEAALLASETTLREAQRLAGVGNWSWDLQSGQHVWSEEIYRIYGRDPALPPALYPEVQAYFEPESWARLTAAVETAIAQGQAYECDAKVLSADGSQRWITARGKATFDANGKVAELHGTVQDITERKQAANALQELNTNLEQRVEQRTAELTAANRELDSFAYGVSHDLRAPLRAMSGFSQALLEDYGDKFQGEAKNYLDQIGIASRKMGELIDGILMLSRITRGELQRDQVDLSPLAAGILSELARTEPERQVATHIEPGLSIQGDGRMIEAVLRNLLGNAWKYTARTPSASIRIHTGEIDGLKGICVTDNGAGFDMAYAARLFQPFQRLHRQDEFPGIGIGLATVQRIVHRHGGEIRAQAAPNAGATFCFSLAPPPLSQLDAGPQQGDKNVPA